jgi:GNAT superfamily N-acetyltransferase
MGCMINQNILINVLTPADLPVFVANFAPYEARFDTDLPHYLAEQDFGFRAVFGAWLNNVPDNMPDNIPVGLATVKWQSEYAPFKYQKLAELADLWVHPQHRRTGVGLALCHFAQKLAKAKGYLGLGLGVQLSAEYGPAQRFYAKNGWLPDGQGVVAHGQKTLENDGVILDAQTAQMWAKRF